MNESDLPDDWDDYLKEMFKKLFGKLPEEIEGSSEEELDSLRTKLLDFLDQYENGSTSMIDDLPDYGDLDNKSLFVHDLTDKDAAERFRNFTKDYDMTLHIEFFTEDGVEKQPVSVGLIYFGQPAKAKFYVEGKLAAKKSIDFGYTMSALIFLKLKRIKKQNIKL